MQIIIFCMLTFMITIYNIHCEVCDAVHNVFARDSIYAIARIIIRYSPSVRPSVRPSVCLSVRLSVCHMCGSVKNA